MNKSGDNRTSYTRQYGIEICNECPRNQLKFFYYISKLGIYGVDCVIKKSYFNTCFQKGLLVIFLARFIPSSCNLLKLLGNGEVKANRKQP